MYNQRLKPHNYVTSTLKRRSTIKSSHSQPILNNFTFFSVDTLVRVVAKATGGLYVYNFIVGAALQKMKENSQNDLSVKLGLFFNSIWNLKHVSQ